MTQLEHKRTQKVHVHVRLPKDLVDWIDRRIEEMVFYNRTHAIIFALRYLKSQTIEAEQLIPITSEELEEIKKKISLK